MGQRPPSPCGSDLRERQLWRTPEWYPWKRRAVGGMDMNDGTIARSPDGRHVRPWGCPVRPHVDHRSVPAAHQSLQCIAGMVRAREGHKPKLGFCPSMRHRGEL
jgi:hypothetical protein